MTSPSPTRRRTTRRRSTPEPRPAADSFHGLLAAAALTLLAAAPAAAAWRDLQRTEPPAPAVSPAGAIEAADAVEMPVADDTAEGVVAPPSGAAGPGVADGAPEAPDPAGPCDDDAADCRDALARLRADSLADVDIDIRVVGRPGSDYPCECRLEGETFEPRRFATTTFTWKAAGYCHKPLYFEHWNLERYGHSHGFVADSVLSAAHFFARIPALPYQMGVELPWECVYPLGYYRPGSCAPWTVPAVPVSGRGFVVGAATATGVVFLLP